MEKKNTHPLRIALIGPESTSKSTLSENLAKHFKTIWVPEYSRIYLEGLNHKYNQKDVLIIAQEQFRQEQRLLKKAEHYIFVDTELIVAKVWCEDVFKTCPAWINETLIKNPYDFYLLTYPDIPWQEDPVRENPHRRMFFFEWYERELKNIHANYAVIKGFGASRLHHAVQAIEKFSREIKN